MEKKAFAMSVVQLPKRKKLRSGNCLPRHVGLLAGFSSLRPEEQKAPTTLEDGLAQYTSLVIGESSASLAFHRTRLLVFQVISKFIPKSEDSGASDSKLAAQSKKVHEIQDLLEELPPKDLNEMAAPCHC